MFPFSFRFARALGWAFLAASVALPALPAIPARAAPATLTVNTAADSPGLCQPVPNGCSLRGAILLSNLNDGQDTIAFNIPGNGVQRITLTSPLPRLTDPAIIDGYTQPGAKQNNAETGTNANLMIEITGKEASDTGLQIGAPVIVRGLVIHSFKVPVEVLGDQGGSVTLQGNFIGVDPTGTEPRISVFGVSTHDLAGARIGGTAPADRNLIAGSAAALDLDGPADVIGNLIGTDRTGARALGDVGRGIILNFDDALVSGNTIAFNGLSGIAVRSGTGNIVSRNTIFANGGLGIDLDEDGPTANDPFDADNGPNKRQNFPELTSAVASGGRTTITGVLRSQRNKVYAVELFSNDNTGDVEAQTFLGEQTVTTDNNGEGSFSFTVNQALASRAITATATDKLTFDTSEISAPVIVTDGQTPPGDPPTPPGDQPTPPGDQPTPPNQGQQGVPELTSAVSPKKGKGKKTKKGKQTIISGTLSSEPNRTYEIAFFGAGQSPLGEASVTTDAAGQASFRHIVKQRLAGQAITATATDTTTGETSAASPAVTVTQQNGKKGKAGKAASVEARSASKADDGKQADDKRARERKNGKKESGEGKNDDKGKGDKHDRKKPGKGGGKRPPGRHGGNR